MPKQNDNLYKLLDNSLKKVKINKYKKGDVAEGIVEKITDSYMIVKIDGVFDALVSSSEMNKDLEKPYQPGDKIKVFVMKPEDDFGVMTVSQKRTTTTQRWDLLEEAFKNDEPIMVEVMEANNGGVIVNIDGVMGFIPTSQLDPNKVYKLEGGDASSKTDMQKDLSRKLVELVGTKIKVKIMEVDKQKNKVIFSEKLLLNDQPSELRMQTMKNIKMGDILEATVTAVTAYGIFVNAQGLDGLVHVSEISWDKVENPSDYAKVGDKIQVKLIDMSDDGKRVAYSVKQLSDDPWSEVSDEFKVGAKVKGTITEIEDYGLIIKIGEGVTGLIHKSELSNEIIGDPRDHFKIGDTVEALVMTIAPSERKMGLSIKKLNGDKSSKRDKKDAKPKKKLPGSLDVAGALAKAGLELEASE